jgi:hypothetical protein
MQIEVSGTFVEMMKSAYMDRASVKIGEREFVIVGMRVDDAGLNASAQVNELIRVKTPWTGEGLPPVGAVCEYDANTNGKEPNWHTVEITYLTEWVIVFRCVKAPWPHFGVGVELAKDVYDGLARSFRPIRTPEQLAAEEREKALEQMVRDCGAPAMMILHTCERLYDAGYRKQEKPE